MEMSDGVLWDHECCWPPYKQTHHFEMSKWPTKMVLTFWEQVTKIWPIFMQEMTKCLYEAKWMMHMAERPNRADPSASLTMILKAW